MDYQVQNENPSIASHVREATGKLALCVTVTQMSGGILDNRTVSAMEGDRRFIPAEGESLRELRDTTP